MAVTWPGALVPTNVSWQLQNQSRSGGVSLTGTEQIVASNAARLTARLDVSANKGSEDAQEGAVLALRAFLAQMEGRVGEILLPAFDGYRPRDAQGRMLNDAEVASLGGLFFFEHWGFGQDELTHATLATNASLGATQISVHLLDGQGPRPGNYFGIGERMYFCRHSWQNEPGGVTFIRFLPRLRNAAVSGARVILDRPVCLMRLASDEAGELVMEMRRWGQTSLDFVEAF